MCYYSLTAYIKCGRAQGLWWNFW